VKPSLSGKQKAGLLGVVLASAGMVATIKHDEGRRHQPYLDIVNVITVCDGITGPDVIPSKTYTDAECNALTVKALEAHGSQLLDCIHVRVTQTMFDAFLGLAYNVGVSATCKSTAIRLLNAGRYQEACDAMLKWNRAGGQVVRGLTLRRERERAQCIKGIPPSTTYGGTANA
jgi:lysozyme